MDYPDIRRNKENTDSNDISLKHQPFELTDDDILNVSADEYIRAFEEQVHKAMAEAVKRNIRANVIAISDKLLYSRLQIHEFDIPMILGLKCVYTRELPDDVWFSIYDAPNPPQTVFERNKQLEEENRRL